MVFQGTRSFGEGVAGLLRRSWLAHLLSDSGENLLWLRQLQDIDSLLRANFARHG